MTAYNIAANIRPSSPVGDMLDARGKLDTHKRAEAELPYVSELLEQKVEMNDQAIAREKVEAKRRPKALEQIETQREQEIQAGADAQKERERAKAFRDDLNKLPREEIREKYPILGAQWYEQQAKQTAESLEGFTAKLDHLDTLSIGERNMAYQQMRKEMPPEAQNVMPAEYDEDAFAKLRHNKDKQLNSFASQMLKEREFYRKVGDTATADAIDDMLLSYYSRSAGSTQSERIADQLFGWAEKPMAAQLEYHRIDGLYTNGLNSLISENMKLSENDKLMLRLGYTDKLTPEGLAEVEKGRQQYHNIAMATLDSDDRDWYLNARKKIKEYRGSRAVDEPDTGTGTTETSHYPGPYSPEYIDKISDLRKQAGLD